MNINPIRNIPALGVLRLCRRGFTLIELLVVIAIIAILATLLVPVLARAKPESKAMACLNNQSQIMLAFKMYSDDNHGVFAPNTTIGTGWVSGMENYGGGSANTNILNLVGPSAFYSPYIKNPATYKCPSDASCNLGKTGVPRIRSYSMSQAVGPNLQGTTAGQGVWLDSLAGASAGPYTVFIRESDLTKLGPANTWITIDENPDSINDAAFAVCMITISQWIDWPSPLHLGATSIAFADGHVELHKWLRPDALLAVRYAVGGPLPSTVNNNPDLVWIEARTSSK